MPRRAASKVATRPPIASSILRRSRRAICTWSNSPVAPGRGRWSCDPGSSGSKVAALLRATARFYGTLPEKSLDALTRIRSNGKHLLDLINTDWSALWVCFRATMLMI